MDQRSPLEARYRFGPFLLDPAERQLIRDGEPVPLTARLFELLLAFVKSPGKVLTKGDLMEFVWPDRIVDEGSLTQAIFSLRKALGDSDDSRYITTVTGRGYCFSVPVESVEPAPRGEVSREAFAPAPAAQTIPASPETTSRNWITATALLALAVVAGGAAYFFWPHSAPASRKPIAVVVADFQNLSNNPMFDKTFTAATKLDLRQSPFLHLLSDGEVADTLDLMTRKKDEALTPALALEVCARNNAQVAVSGTIAQVGANYLLTLTATNCVNGQVLHANKSEVRSLDALLPALDRLAEAVRQHLGEPTESIAKFNVPMERQRTASFEALRAYSEGYYDFDHGKYIEAIPLFQRAIEIDPKFAAAYDGLSTAYSNTHNNKLDAENITKAYALRDNASELEKLHISMRYDFSVLGDINEGIRVLRAWTELYPDDAAAWSNLANQEGWVGENAPAIRDGEQAIALNPTMETAYVVTARAEMHAGRFDQAAATCALSIAKHVDGFDTHRLVYDIAFMRGDAAGMRREMAWASGKPAERFMLIEAGLAALAEGQIDKGQEIFARALELGKSLGLVNFMAAPNAKLLYDLGAKDAALQTLAEVPAGYDSADYRFDLMEMGDAAQGQALLDADIAKAPSNTLLIETFAPQERAVLALRQNRPLEAAKMLAPAVPIELRTFDIPYIWGESWLAAHDGAKAAVEFRKIIDNRGVEPVSPYTPLAYLGLARALGMQHDFTGSRAAYQKLFTLWKNADPDLPALRDAKREFAELSPS